MAREVRQDREEELDLNQLAHRIVREATEDKEGQRAVEPPSAERTLPPDADPDEER
jgi:hypothetical protein